MKYICVLAAAAAMVVSSSVVWAGPKDKTQNALIDPSSITGTPGVWDNTVARLKVQMKKCKIQVKGKDLASALGGEEIICIAGADVKSGSLPPGGAGNSIILAGIVDSGKLKLKMKSKLGQVGCGLPGNASISYNTSVECYRQDLAYTSGGWQSLCSGVPALPLPGDGSDGLVGLCQGFAPGDRVPPPSSALLTVVGQYTPVH